MHEMELLKPADVARIFDQSISWVSKNHKKLGGVKIGGRMFFPPKEKLYERLFCGEEGLEIRFHAEGGKAHLGMVQDQTTGQRGRAGKTIRVAQADLNRHGLLDAPKPSPG